mmetsp:Transcript_5474/g.8484  ORF Transcript_5474/g.8484 Transcript_5474/m.8484 type:complete len:290 (+) Transcript_5474:183-1052(+)
MTVPTGRPDPTLHSPSKHSDLYLDYCPEHHSLDPKRHRLCCCRLCYSAPNHGCSRSKRQPHSSHRHRDVSLDRACWCCWLAKTFPWTMQLPPKTPPPNHLQPKSPAHAFRHLSVQVSFCLLSRASRNTYHASMGLVRQGLLLRDACRVLLVAHFQVLAARFLSLHRPHGCRARNSACPSELEPFRLLHLFLSLCLLQCLCLYHLYHLREPPSCQYLAPSCLQQVLESAHLLCRHSPSPFLSLSLPSHHHWLHYCQPKQTHPPRRNHHPFATDHWPYPRMRTTFKIYKKN